MMSYFTKKTHLVPRQDNPVCLLLFQVARITTNCTFQSTLSSFAHHYRHKTPLYDQQHPGITPFNTK